ncbi:unnamed protein product [Mycena citricolor]|uniref:Uncharacterized protein n=1 Tax=Mycena citricolor TaxID=2018698 RepID=A0AAD2K477_9AGAR|nr:unnamed protein product [Mycena citricolor]
MAPRGGPRGDAQTGIEDDGTMSSPAVTPSDEVKSRFWKRVAEITSRYHNVETGWTGTKEVRDWNHSNPTACDKCLRSRVERQCIIDEDQPSCRPCRDAKISCDRKCKFIYDLTKDDFFPEYALFLHVYNDRKPGQLRKLKQAEASFRYSPRSLDTLSTRRGRMLNAQKEHTRAAAADKVDGPYPAPEFPPSGSSLDPYPPPLSAPGTSFDAFSTSSIDALSQQYSHVVERARQVEDIARSIPPNQAPLLGVPDFVGLVNSLVQEVYQFREALIQGTEV